MKASVYNLIFYLIIALSFVGLVSFMVTNPVSLIIQIAIGGLVIGLGVLLYKRFINHQSNKGNESAAYRRAVRQSKRRFKLGSKSRAARSSHLKVIRSKQQKRQSSITKLKRKNHGHLTVIDGKKNKKKKRMLF
ncbi:SA1362 family protein [Scopulibacillus cellulosilyticus]|uniref:SA1362 family protein n=1 Tax=Scopulibacillus cellulosilyticus TaxID=2665665 RepID=A0ABW2PY11_9BACL